MDNVAMLKMINYVFLANGILILSNILIYFKVACNCIVPKDKLIVVDSCVYDGGDKYKKCAFLMYDTEEFNKINKATLEFEVKVLPEEFIVNQYTVKPTTGAVKRSGDVEYSISRLYDREISESLQESLKNFREHIKEEVVVSSAQNPQTMLETFKKEWQAVGLKVDNSILISWNGKINWEKETITI